MIKTANEQGITVKQLGDRFIDEYFKDAKGLNIRPASVHPRATEHIKEIIDLISTLIEKGHAYIAENGDVYYSAESFKGYGKLSGQVIEDLELGSGFEARKEKRLDATDVKRHPADFALWKAKKEGEPFWSSPFSEGRPGWHIECSAMSMKYLGETIDIHAGGQDLQFPHHENEIAQSEGATGKPFANYWMHNGYINVDNRKMSKSLGNFFTVREIAEQVDLIAVRLFMLSAQYRNPINYSYDLITQAKSALDRIYNCRESIKDKAAADKTETNEFESFKQRFIDAMDDDLNTADAISVIFELIRFSNASTDTESSSAFAKALYDTLFELCDTVLGVHIERKKDDMAADDVAEIEKLIAERTVAKKAKDFATADAIRAKLLDMGIVIEDTREGVKWKKA